MELYKNANQEVKHEVLAKYATDRSLKWLSTWVKEIKESRTVTNGQVEDWMTELGT